MCSSPKRAKPTCSWWGRVGSAASKDCCSALSASSACTTHRARSRSCRTAAGPTDSGPMTALDLDELSAHWRLALNTAQDAVRAAELYLPAPEQHALQAGLLAERADTARLLDALASEEHVRLVHRLDMPRPSRRMLGLTEDVDA